MTDTKTDLANWPTTCTGQPILNSTNEALLYAQLIPNNTTKQQDLIRCRERAYFDLKVERESTNPNFDRMISLASTAHFYQEAFMETTRIFNESYPR